MAFKKNGVAYIFICFLVVDALASHSVTSPLQLRGNKRIASSQSANYRRDVGKHFAIPSNKILARKSNKNKGSSNCGCGDKSHSSISHHCFQRSYETIGSCDTTINVVRDTQKSVDYVEKESVCFQTVQNHSTSYNILTCTSTTKRFIEHHTAVIEVLKKCYRTVQTLTTISVCVSTVIVNKAVVQRTKREKAVVKTLKPKPVMKKVLTSESVCARRITDTCGDIKHVKRVHERISQSIARTVTCEKPKSQCGKSNSKSVSKCA